MNPNSYAYLFFLLLAACIFWALPQAARRWFVLLASVAAYVISEGAHIGILLAIVAGTWIPSRMMSRQPARKGLWCNLGITFVVAVLCIFKYRDFFAANVNAVLAACGLPALGLEPLHQLPLGISFAAFTAIAFLLDTKQERVQPQTAATTASFLCFWPVSMAGPILRFRELGSQLSFARNWDMRMLTRGLDRIVWGLVQKNVIANALEAATREGFMPQAAAANSTLDNWFLAAAFGLQIYFDFASYTNLAIGAAQLIGVTLPENFRFPYHAANPAEFWSRWHMSLSRWVRDYLFFPLSARFREAGPRLYLSLVAVMAVVGLWHGPSWGFVLWGVMHGCYLVAFRAWQTAAGNQEEMKPALRTAANLFWRVFMLAGAAAAWVPFRAATLGQTGKMFESMFLNFRLGASYSANFYVITLLVAALCAAEPYICGKLKQWDQSLATGWLREVNLLTLRPAIYALGLFLFLVLDDRDTRFIYFQF